MNRLAKLAFIFLSAALATSVALAAPGRDTPPKPSPAVEQAIRSMSGVREISEVAISPDGRRVAWVESLSGKNGSPSSNSAIYVADWKSGAAPQRITAAAAGAAAAENEVAWSPDSKSLAFFSDAAHVGEPQLYVTSVSGSSRQLTHVKGDVSTPRWSSDGKTIAFLYIPNAPRAAGPLAAETQPEGVIRADSYEQRLALVDALTGVLRLVSPADMYVYEYDWSPDSTKIVATAAHGNGDDNWYDAQIYIFDALHVAAPQSIYKSDMQIGTPKWSRDGNSVAFVAGLMSDEGSIGGDIYTVPANSSNATSDARDITPDIKASPASLEWSADSHSIIFGEIIDGQSGVASVNLDSGEISQLYTGAERLSSSGYSVAVALSRDGKTAAAVRQSYDHPPEVWAGLIGSWKQVTHLNSALHPGWGKAETLHWQSDMGDQKIQGWLLYPTNYDPAKKYGLIVTVHGGPASATLPGWPGIRSFYAALPAAGYFVLFPNPRGSYGAGEAFTKANVKDFGGGDFRDIMAGVDVALASLPIDPNRLGITGWSYGGYMSMWAVTQTHRFKAAVIGAGLSDWLSYYGENQIDKWMTFYFGDTVYNDPGVYAKSAPINFIKNAQTPSLIVVGDSDGECPPPQSFEFWHALVTFGVPTEFVVYPHEGHGFSNPAHSRDIINRSVAWFNSHLQ